ncbi:uncharacterized protein GGS25DRAFT_524885 [Hypoxylon fragiforme]|uniref:uncharacterized protein n=1 Tax=Hypoxylon fragiforme TaxID=63214 RepID=UPI0020C7110A|nr:uncharacterized protein GGS25DRAFT_524885 [Hypoxylon fragiforme]KAI2605369.1 hypothetical protein GGS25DRAFT_524885 [Hypoxylon fragiforme]
MAASQWKSTLYASDQFVEACGAVVFDTSTSPSPSPSSPAQEQPPRKVLLLHYTPLNEWLLPKGRRNCSEPRPVTAVREVLEESGYAVRLCPLTMATRAPSALEPADVRDVPRTYEALTEPFVLDFRELGGGDGVKLVWWYIAELEGVEGGVGKGEEGFEARWFPCAEAVERLTFRQDREVLERALGIVGVAATGREG